MAVGVVLYLWLSQCEINPKAGERKTTLTLSVHFLKFPIGAQCVILSPPPTVVCYVYQRKRLHIIVDVMSSVRVTALKPLS